MAPADYEYTGLYPHVGIARTMTHAGPHELHRQAAQIAEKPASRDALAPNGVLGADLHATILHHCTDAIVAHTPDGTLLYANPAALHQWRCSSIADVRARGPWGWIPPEQQPRIAGRMGRIRLDGQARFDSISRTCSGDSLSAEVYARYVETPDGPLIISVVRDITSRIQSEEMVRYLAYHDSLTGLANRALFTERLEAALEEGAHVPTHTGLLYIDLNDFKPVNDRYGHAVGDSVLRRVADRISVCVRQSDTVARVGGDEFIVLTPAVADEQELSAVRLRIHEAIRRPVNVGSLTIKVTASIGSAIHRAHEPLDAFVARADRAMFDHRIQTGRSGLRR